MKAPGYDTKNADELLDDQVTTTTVKTVKCYKKY